MASRFLPSLGTVATAVADAPKGRETCEAGTGARGMEGIAGAVGVAGIAGVATVTGTAAGGTGPVVDGGGVVPTTAPRGAPCGTVFPAFWVSAADRSVTRNMSVAATTAVATSATRPR